MRVRYVLGALILMFGAAVMMAIALTPVFAHQAPLGWSYAAKCCSGKDCAQAVKGAVIEGPSGYEITILPGQHPMVKDKVFRAVLPYDSKKIIDSPDGLYHVCISPSGGLLCLYAGSRGF